MKKVLWIQGATPDGMTEEKFMETKRILANTISGELVEFGNPNSHIIIGDAKSEELFNTLKGKMNS